MSTPRAPEPAGHDSRAPECEASALRRFFDRLAHPLHYTPADRSFIAGAIMLFGVTLFVVMVEYAGGWPYLPPDVDPALMRLLARMSRWAIAPWLGLLLVVVLFR